MEQKGENLLTNILFGGNFIITFKKKELKKEHTNLLMMNVLQRFLNDLLFIIK
jgi:hypothetical protein